RTTRRGSRERISCSTRGRRPRKRRASVRSSSGGRQSKSRRGRSTATFWCAPTSSSTWTERIRKCPMTEGIEPAPDNRSAKRSATAGKTTPAGKFDPRRNLARSPSRPTTQQQLRRKLVVLLCALLLAVVAVLTNPDPEQHTAWREKSQPRSSAAQSEYHSYLFFSTTTGDGADSRVSLGCF